MEKLKEYTNPEYYENRELSWIKFNGRVLNKQETNPFRCWNG